MTSEAAEAPDVRAALDAYRREKPDLVTLDLCLPDENGLTALQRLRRIDPYARVLLVTGSDQRAVEEEALRLRALDVLHMPFELQEVADMLEKISPRLRPRSQSEPR